MYLNDHEKPALILIDIQKGFDDIIYWGGHRNNQDAEVNASELLAYWRKRTWPIFHIKHCSLTPASPLVKGKPGNEFQEIVTPLPEETIIEKHVNSAFIGTNLKDQLDNAGITTIVIAGLTTDHCVSTTTRMAGNFGYRTYLIHDATATFDKKGINGEVYTAELIHQTALASLKEEFAIIKSTKNLLDT